MLKVICHPDNWEKVKQWTVQQDAERRGKGFWFTDHYTVVADPHMDRDKPTGKYILPSGSVVERDKVVVKERFVEYGPEDIDWLLYAGVIAEEREMMFYVIEDLAFRSLLNYAPVLDARTIFYPFY